MNLIVKSTAPAEVCYDVIVLLVFKVLVEFQNVLVIVQLLENPYLIEDVIEAFLKLVSLKHLLYSENLLGLFVNY